MRRIAIIGSPGAGKTTFARQLGEITGIEVFHLDRLFWKPGWVETPRPEWTKLQERIVKNDEWIIDGHYGSTMNIRIQAADTVIYLDLPRRICLFRAVRRAIRYRGQTRPDMGEGCNEKIDFEFLRYIWNFKKKGQERILPRLQEVKRQGKQIIRLRTKRQVKKYLAVPHHN